MNKFFFSVASAAVLSCASFSAAAATKDGFFIGVNGGTASYDISHTDFDHKRDSAFGALAGYRWVVDRPFSLGVEAGYVDLGKITSKDAYVDDSFDFSDTFKDRFAGKAVLVGINGKWDLPNQLSITAHAGVAHSRITYTLNEYYRDGSYHETDRIYHGSSTDNAIYAGLGFGYDFSQHFSLTLNYDHYALKAEDLLSDKRTVNVGVFGVAAEFRF